MGSNGSSSCTKRAGNRSVSSSILAKKGTRGWVRTPQTKNSCAFCAQSCCLVLLPPSTTVVMTPSPCSAISRRIASLTAGWRLMPCKKKKRIACPCRGSFIIVSRISWRLPRLSGGVTMPTTTSSSSLAPPASREAAAVGPKLTSVRPAPPASDELLVVVGIVRRGSSSLAGGASVSGVSFDPTAATSPLAGAGVVVGIGWGPTAASPLVGGAGAVGVGRGPTSAVAVSGATSGATSGA
mmetsp:Transcript_15337/g.38877  ORF Transcript_15337/g.38877 Transcript_15337/m.38877 type:complete len:239 (+) Transcript_15337:918-1634(+)